LNSANPEDTLFRFRTKLKFNSMEDVFKGS
jgi:hypothetical protein